MALALNCHKLGFRFGNTQFLQNGLTLNQG